MNDRLARTALLLTSLLAVPYAGADELSVGKTLVSNHCAACHTFGKGEPAGQGPNLFGIVGRQAGIAEGFSYSNGFRNNMANRTWDSKLLDRWLTDTQALAPGSGMVYFQDDAVKRARIIRYLATLK